MVKTQYVKSLVPQLLQGCKVHNEYGLKDVFLEDSNESLYNKMRSDWSTHAGSTLDELTRYETVLRALEKKPDVNADEAFDHPGSLMHHEGRQESSSRVVIVINQTNANNTPTINACSVMVAELSLQLQQSAVKSSSIGSTSKFDARAQ